MRARDLNYSLNVKIETKKPPMIFLGWINKWSIYVYFVNGHLPTNKDISEHYT